MGPYKVLIRKQAEKELRGVPQPYLKHIVDKILRLTHAPRPSGVEKLSGEERYRLRHSDWRVVYGVDDTTRVVTVVKIGHRREVYR